MRPWQKRHMFLGFPFLIKISFIETETKRSGNHLFRILGQLSALYNMNNQCHQHCYFRKQPLYIAPE